MAPLFHAHAGPHTHGMSHTHGTSHPTSTGMHQHHTRAIKLTPSNDQPQPSNDHPQPSNIVPIALGVGATAMVLITFLFAVRHFLRKVARAKQHLQKKRARRAHRGGASRHPTDHDHDHEYYGDDFSLRSGAPSYELTSPPPVWSGEKMPRSRDRRDHRDRHGRRDRRHRPAHGSSGRVPRRGAGKHAARRPRRDPLPLAGLNGRGPAFSFSSAPRTPSPGPRSGPQVGPVTTDLNQ